MLIPKENRLLINETLFREGVLTGVFEGWTVQHPELRKVRNLEVIKLMQSYATKGYVKTQMAWKTYYYTLTDEGCDFLRTTLNIPADVVPNSHKRVKQQQQMNASQVVSALGGANQGNANAKETASAAYRPTYGVGRGAPVSAAA